MNWFSSSPFDTEIERATSEKNTGEPWDVIMMVCDKVKGTPGSEKDCLRAILKRMGHNDPHVVLQAIILLDACVINCGKKFHLEIASRDFESEYKKLLSKHEPPVPLKLRLMLKKWAEGDFKTDPQLDLIPSLYAKLKNEGHDFTDTTIQKSQVVFSKDPNVVSSQQEEEDIAKAIELSLKEKGGSPKMQTNQTASSLYPSVSLGGGGGNSVQTAGATPASEPRKVRALYDFEAAEDNEMTFVAGEIIHVVDDSDPNWWKGYNKKGEGLFPSNFVTADLSVEPESLKVDKTKKTVQFSDEEKEREERHEIQTDIDEEKIDRLFHLLSEANPEDPSQDTEEMIVLENQVNQMGPLIDAELERVDRKHAQLTQLSSDLVDAINLYHTLMRDSDRPMSAMYPPMYNPQPWGPQQLPSGMYQNMPNLYQMPTGVLHQNMIHNMHPGSMIQQPSQPMSAPSQLQQMPSYVPQSNQMIPQQHQNGHLPSIQQQNPQQQQTISSQNQHNQMSSVQQISQQQQQQHQQQQQQQQQSLTAPQPQQNMPNQQQQHNPNTHFQPLSTLPPANNMQSQSQHLTMHHNNPNIVQQHQMNSQIPMINNNNLPYSSVIGTSILPPGTDTKTNIPIYQQQR